MHFLFHPDEMLYFFMLPHICFVNLSVNCQFFGVLVVTSNVDTSVYFYVDGIAKQKILNYFRKYHLATFGKISIISNCIVSSRGWFVFL